MRYTAAMARSLTRFRTEPRIFAAIMAAAAALILPAAAAALEPGPFPAGFDDHAASRLRYQPAVIAAAPAKALKFEDAVHEGASGKTWIYVRDLGKEFHVRFAAGPEGSSPSPGDALFRRRADRGTIIEMRFELDPSIGSYLTLRAKNSDRTLLSVYADGKAIASDVELRSPIFYLFTVPLSKVATLAGDRVPWGLAFAEPRAAAAAAARGDGD